MLHGLLKRLGGGVAKRLCAQKDTADWSEEYGAVLDREDQGWIPRGKDGRVSPWIEKFWIFGLLNGEDLLRAVLQRCAGRSAALWLIWAQSRWVSVGASRGLDRGIY